MKKLIGLALSVVLFGIVCGFIMAGGASNFTRIVFGDANFGTDPNPTADITGQNDEYISNYVDGIWNFGAANLSTTGTLGVGNTAVTGKLTVSDSLRIGLTSIFNGTITANGATTHNSNVTIRNPVAGNLYSLRMMSPASG